MPGRLRFDAVNECLWQGDTAIALRLKAFAVLKHLVDDAGQLVTKQQLLEAVWPGTFVGDASSRTASDRCARRWATMRPRRFTSPRHTGGDIASSVISRRRLRARLPVRLPQCPRLSERPARRCARGASPPGTKRRAAAMRGWRKRAWRGERRLPSSPGSGHRQDDSAERSRRHVVSLRRGQIVRAQCLQHYGDAERTCRSWTAVVVLPRPDGTRRHRICGVSTYQRGPGARHALFPRLTASSCPRASRIHCERMPREMAEAVRSIAADVLLVVVLEDLEWSDIHAGSDRLPGAAANRRDCPGGGHYRPVDATG